ncbi:hypothetical protein F4802DRAFT_592648 [Xylaria palmicola]|nr:hypothetical protein F4802DRAFT_592648 [Xylaria palmicola]
MADDNTTPVHQSPTPSRSSLKDISMDVLLAGLGSLVLTTLLMVQGADPADPAFLTILVLYIIYVSMAICKDCGLADGSILLWTISGFCATAFAMAQL